MEVQKKKHSTVLALRLDASIIHSYSSDRTLEPLCMSNSHCKGSKCLGFTCRPDSDRSSLTLAAARFNVGTIRRLHRFYDAVLKKKYKNQSALHVE